MKKINHLDLFSGIGGFHLGFERAGFKINSFFSEIDKHAIAVYKHNFPNSNYVGSVTNVRGGDLPRIDLITFGSPCQDFSLAGKRAGMGGDRSSLILEAIRLIGECRPRVFVWENVKGAFSSNAGEDFAAIIQEFANIGGYQLEWQLLNTSWFLPQNRERIYLIGYSTTPKRGWRGVFPIGETSKLSNTKKCNEGQEPTGLQDEDNIARALNARPAFGSGSEDTFIKIKQIGTKFDSNGGTQLYQQDRVYDADGHAPALNQGKSDLIVKVKSATSNGYEEATIGDSINLSNPNSETRRGRVGSQRAQTLETSCNQAVVQPVQIGQSNKTFAAQSGTLIGKENQDAFTLRAANPNGVLVKANYTYENPQTLETSCNQAVVEPMIGIGIYGNNKQSQYQKEVTRALALKASNQTNPRSGGTTLVGNQYRIRRLTPIECERLQGFPDDHTSLGNYDGETKPMSNTQRYKQCGNAVTVDVVEAVAKRCIPLL